MEPEDLLLKEQIHNIETVESNNKKERLYQVIATGKSKMYLGTQITVEQVQAFTSEEVTIYYARYESVLGARMAKSVGKSLISVYTKAFNYFFQVKDIDYLTDDLTADPIVSSTISSIACELYYRYGNILGPIAIALISANHIDFSPDKNGGERRNSENEGEEEGEGESGKSN